MGNHLTCPYTRFLTQCVRSFYAEWGRECANPKQTTKLIMTRRKTRVKGKYFTCYFSKKKWARKKCTPHASPFNATHASVPLIVFVSFLLFPQHVLPSFVPLFRGCNRRSSMIVPRPPFERTRSETPERISGARNSRDAPRRAQDYPTGLLSATTGTENFQFRENPLIPRQKNNVYPDAA